MEPLTLVGAERRAASSSPVKLVVGGGPLGVGVMVGVVVAVGVTVVVGVAVGVRLGVAVWVTVGVAVGRGVRVDVGVAVASAPRSICKLAVLFVSLDSAMTF